jgi:hypothetical protein
VSEQIRLAPAVSADLMSEIIAAACARLPVLNRAGKASSVHRLIESTAWTDAALALVEIELPMWKLRRLVFEDGRWFCSLSAQVNLPLWLDDTADATHEILPLAILGALLEARRRSVVVPERTLSVPQVQSPPGHAICCDNFS